jgi:hypothetical protein
MSSSVWMTLAPRLNPYFFLMLPNLLLQELLRAFFSLARILGLFSRSSLRKLSLSVTKVESLVGVAGVVSSSTGSVAVVMGGGGVFLTLCNGLCALWRTTGGPDILLAGEPAVDIGGRLSRTLFCFPTLRLTRRS